jgi:hypothetical protein
MGVVKYNFTASFFYRNLYIINIKIDPGQS